jgi:NAD(P)-dependent dehydrogenase (short-subunit alcohol dehydrogenase family)
VEETAGSELILFFSRLQLGTMSDHLNKQGFKTGEDDVPGSGDFVCQTQIDKQWERPGLQHLMIGHPVSTLLPNETGSYNEKGYPEWTSYLPANKLSGRRALITGGDSGIGKAVALQFAMEGANIAITCLRSELEDAEQTQTEIKQMGRLCTIVVGDVSNESTCLQVINETITHLGGLDILVNNAAEQHLCERLEDLSEEQMLRTFRSNIFPMFLLTKHALKHLPRGASIINTTSVVGYRGSANLLDYGATKGAITSFTRCLAKQLASRGIRVNAVAPGPVWTPLQPISRNLDSMDEFCNNAENLIGRVAQPSEIAPSFVFLASNDSSQFNGQCLHPNGGEIINT